MRQVEVYVKGPGGPEQGDPLAPDRGLEVTAITDVTPIPHNGCAATSGAASGRESIMARYTGPVCRLCRREGASSS